MLLSALSKRSAMAVAVCSAARARSPSSDSRPWVSTSFTKERKLVLIIRASRASNTRRLIPTETSIPSPESKRSVPIGTPAISIASRDDGGKLPRQKAVPTQPMKSSRATEVRRPGLTAMNSPRIQITKPQLSSTVARRTLASSRYASSALKSAFFNRNHCASRTRHAAMRAAGKANRSHVETVSGRTSPMLTLLTRSMA